MHEINQEILTAQMVALTNINKLVIISTAYFVSKKGFHSSGWCKVREHSMKFNEQKCLKHNSCFSCLKTTDHKSESCPDRRECKICRKFHHFNLHPRLDIIKYYQEKKRGPGSQ